MPSDVRPTLEGWPIVEVVYPADVSVYEIGVVLDAIARLLSRHERFAVIHHATSSLDASTRRFLAERSREQGEARSRFLVAEAVVTRSPLVRGVVSAVQWLSPYPNPLRAFDDADPARAWCRARVGDESRAHV